jgi:hypothetical protein
MAVAITALTGGLVIGPVTQQAAEAQVYGGLKSAGTTGGAIGENNLILVGAAVVTAAAMAWSRRRPLGWSPWRRSFCPWR